MAIEFDTAESEVADTDGTANMVGTADMVGAADVLCARVREHSHVVVEHEIRRLSRRARYLSRRDIAVIEAALDDLAERLILARLRSLPHRSGQFAVLFDVADDA